MPALMINRLKNRNFNLIFDADGFPLEERVDFSGMSKSSKQYQFLKAEETLMLNNADGVLNRSKKAIGIHQKTIANNNIEKFSVVTNGRNIDFFSPQLHLTNKIKTELNIPLDAIVFGYCGSLGAKYGLQQIISVFEKYHQGQQNSYLVLLTGNVAIAKESIPNSIVEYSKIMSVPFLEVPKYLNIFDFAFAIIEPKWSMQGAAAVKIGEYLLMGIPTIASAGIGDTDEILENQKQCFLFNHEDHNAIENSLNFIKNCKNINSNEIRKFAIQYFSIENSVESYLNALKKLG
jgi:glycosyltransferase involved in cell wall biosynthesis